MRAECHFRATRAIQPRPNRPKASKHRTRRREQREAHHAQHKWSCRDIPCMLVTEDVSQSSMPPVKAVAFVNITVMAKDKRRALRSEGQKRATRAIQPRPNRPEASRHRTRRSEHREAQNAQHKWSCRDILFMLVTEDVSQSSMPSLLAIGDTYNAG